MFPYAVFTLARQLRPAAQGRALGYGPVEVSYITDAHRLGAGDVIYINDTFLRIHGVDAGTLLWFGHPVEYEVLGSDDEPGLLVLGHPWTGETRQRLRRSL